MSIKVHLLTILFITTILSDDWNYSADIAELKTLNNEKVKQFDGNVVINKDNLQLKTKKAIQYVDKEEIHLYDDITMINGESIITCDELIYYIKDEFCIAKHNVVLNQSENTVKSDTLFYWDVKDSIKAIGNIQLNQKNNKRRLLSNEMHIFNSDSITQVLKLYNSAEVYSITESRVEKDKPLMKFEDVMKGKSVKAIIVQDTIQALNIYGMAIADYNVIKDSMLIGLNNVSGDSILMNFDQGNLNRIQVFEGAIGQFTPEGNNSKVDSIINYNAEYIDYIINDEKSVLNDNAKVEYKGTIIESGKIIVDWDTNMLDADKIDDNYPIVTKAGESPMAGESMKFDLINKKGTIKMGRTSFNDGFYRGKTIQRQEPNILHMHNSIYTSCEKEEPHYYFKSKKMKMLQGDKIIARPITLFISDFPIIGLPFAILPNKGGGRTSGWIMPSFGHSNSRGNFLQNLGYYWAPSDYFDFKFLISLYDYSGFNTKSTLRYKKRYLFDGSVKSKLNRRLKTDLTDDIVDVFSDKTTQDWDIHWIHNQTINPYEKFNLDITYVTSNDFYQSDNIGLDLSTRLTQQIVSSVNYNKTWPYKKNSLNIYLSEVYDLMNDNNSELHIINEGETNNNIFSKQRYLPKLSFRHNSTKLFGEGGNWYNNIYSSYSLDATDYQREGYYIHEESDAVIDTLDQNMGVVQNINFSMTNKIFKWFNITPNISIKESWIFKYKDYEINESEGTFSDSYNYINSFKRRTSGSLSLSTSTKLYGIIPFNMGSINSLRHVVSPTVSYSYYPDLSSNSNYFQTSPAGEIKDYFSGSIVGGTPSIESKQYSVVVRNDFQLKYKNQLDVYEKINFLNWTLSSSYNPGLDSLNWSSISSTVQATIPNLFNLDISMNHDLYKQKYFNDSYQRVNEFEDFPRLTYISASTDLGLTGNKFGYSQESEVFSQDTLDFDDHIELAQSNDSYEPVIHSDKIWDTNLRLRYALQSYTEEDNIKWDKTFWVNTDINVNLSSNWKMTYSARFDMENNSIVSHSLYFFRPLHCWEFSFKWWPSGDNSGFILNIYVKNPDLRDIKLKSTGGSFFGL